jgi:hypothetical protein
MTTFLRLLELSADEKPDGLLVAVAGFQDPARRDEAFQRTVFEREPNLFAAVPGSPFAYWVSEAVRGAFQRFSPFEGSQHTAKQGLVTADDFRFLRTWWEVSPRRLGERWFGFAKGGAFSPFYSDVVLVVGYSEGDKVGLQAIGRYGRGATHYFRPGLTWPRRTQSGLGLRAMPAGCIFADKGPAAFIEGDSPDRLLSLLAIMTSMAFCYLVELQMAFGSYEVGVIQRTPVPDLSDDNTSTLARLAARAWSIKRSLDITHEASHAFLLPPSLSERLTGAVDGAAEKELESIKREIDGIVFQLYGIGAEDRVAIEASFSRETESDGSHDAAGDDEVASEDEGSVNRAADALISWLVGVAFGRFDPRVATGERSIPPDPEPFDPLPSRAPGMYPDGEEPADRPDILVDDEGHSDDLVARAQAIAERIKVDLPENLRGWIAKEFFPLHIKLYSKSRRKAPIYWQLAIPSAGYSVWLYIHAFSKDTLLRVQNDYVAPKLAHEERRLETLTKDLRDGATSAQRKALAANQVLVEALRAFLEEVKRVAPLWNPNLDDGILINYAPLWRLVPQNKSWQKELKSTWDELCEGQYDWANLAMHLWPERVVPKCAKDRSLAIAHGIEEVFWVERADSKWSARKTPTRSVEELVRERTSPAVKAALKNLLEAPVGAGNAGRGGVGRRRPAVAEGGDP